MILTNPLHVYVANKIIMGRLVEPLCCKNQSAVFELAAIYTQVIICRKWFVLFAFRKYPSFERVNRSFLNMISDGLASISSRMDLLVSLSGALTTSLLGLVVPAGLDLLLSENISTWKKAKNWFLISHHPQLFKVTFELIQKYF